MLGFAMVKETLSPFMSFNIFVDVVSLNKIEVFMKIIYVYKVFKKMNK